MSTDHDHLIAVVFNWLPIAIERRDYDRARGLWRVIDALYGDMAIFRTPGHLERARKVLVAMQQTVEVQAIRKELEV